MTLWDRLAHYLLGRDDAEADGAAPTGADAASDGNGPTLEGHDAVLGRVLDRLTAGERAPVVLDAAAWEAIDSLVRGDESRRAAEWLERLAAPLGHRDPETA